MVFPDQNMIREKTLINLINLALLGKTVRIFSTNGNNKYP